MPSAGHWSFDFDWDEDGVIDSRVSEMATIGQYSGFDPVHNRAGNILFPDGAILRTPIADWAQNKGQLWGEYKGADVPIYH